MQPDDVSLWLNPIEALDERRKHAGNTNNHYNLLAHLLGGIDPSAPRRRSEHCAGTD